jgi:hypothetical protein
MVASRAATLIARGQIGEGWENDTRVFFDRARFCSGWGSSWPSVRSYGQDRGGMFKGPPCLFGLILQLGYRPRVFLVQQQVFSFVLPCWARIFFYGLPWIVFGLKNFLFLYCFSRFCVNYVNVLCTVLNTENQLPKI